MVALPRPDVLSNEAAPFAAPKLTPVIRFPPASKRFTASPFVLRPMPLPPYVPMIKPLGTLLPNQDVVKALMLTGVVLSMNTSACPGAMLVTYQTG
jgi:hypothetical protein